MSMNCFETQCAIIQYKLPHCRSEGFVSSAICNSESLYMCLLFFILFNLTVKLGNVQMHVQGAAVQKHNHDKNSK